ncbi:MAG TPA: RNA polymerase sigma factor [Polyangiaceae bacterium]|nr:RNA polymerase sigma factor [Polyangiaceae bacterium]
MITRSTSSRATTQNVGAPDPDLLRRLASGDIGALGELYDRHSEPVRRFLARATSNAEDVDDLVHATFLAAAKSAARYDGRPSCRPWLMGIAVQLLRRRRRSLGHFFAILSSLRGVQGVAHDPRPTLHARIDVDRALTRISEPKRVALLLAEVEGLSCAEIAKALDVPIGTVWTRLHAARRELRRLLEEGREE